MQIFSTRHGRRPVTFTCAAAALAAAAIPSGAGAAPVVSDLRVEAGGVVVTNSSYPTDSQSFTTDTSKPACGGSGQTKSLTGPTALGLLNSASAVDADLRPVRISDRFSFGLLVCGIGSFTAGEAFWLYKVNHVAPEIGSDAFKLSGGEDVLFFLQDAARGRNTGDELVVDAPARARPGQVEIIVSAYGFNGARKPAAGAKVFAGGASATADAAGRARLDLAGSASVRAGRSGDIPSAPVRICVADDLDDCPAARGKRIYGGGGADRLSGTPGAAGHVVEYAGPAIERMGMEGRFTVCNMTIEAGGRAGMIAPDDTTFDYLQGRPAAPAEVPSEWRELRSEPDAAFDREVVVDASSLSPQVTWGTTPGMVAPVTGAVPEPAGEGDERALAYMGLDPGTPIEEIELDRVFIGSCTNSRIGDLRAAARVVEGRHVSDRVEAMVVPGSASVKAQAEREGLDEVFRRAGFDWRSAGCSMCLGMNPDILRPGERCASTSNRNFEGRQGRGGRSHLVSPEMAAAAAVEGRFVDIRGWA